MAIMDPILGIKFKIKIINAHNAGSAVFSEVKKAERGKRTAVVDSNFVGIVDIEIFTIQQGVSQGRRQNAGKGSFVAPVELFLFRGNGSRADLCPKLFLVSAMGFAQALAELIALQGKADPNGGIESTAKAEKMGRKDSLPHTVPPFSQVGIEFFGDHHFGVVLFCKHFQRLKSWGCKLIIFLKTISDKTQAFRFYLREHSPTRPEALLPGRRIHGGCRIRIRGF